MFKWIYVWIACSLGLFNEHFQCDRVLLTKEGNHLTNNSRTPAKLNLKRIENKIKSNKNTSTNEPLWISNCG